MLGISFMLDVPVNLRGIRNEAAHNNRAICDNTHILFFKTFRANRFFAQR
jgi:hypothetical protein